MYELNAMKTVLGDDYAFKQTKTVEEVKKILETGEMEGNNTTPFVLQAGNLDIEMNIKNFGTGVITENGVETEPISLEYFCCIRKYGEWESYEEIPYPVNLNVSDLEAEMFRVLDKFAEKRALSFFAENDHISGQLPEIENDEDLEM
jgi:hypothetical protein